VAVSLGLGLSPCSPSEVGLFYVCHSQNEPQLVLKKNERNLLVLHLLKKPAKPLPGSIVRFSPSTS
jgi:hypothetical protein